jgi:hypothetical protein
LVDESGAGGVTFDRLVCADRGDVFGVVGCPLVKPTVRAMAVVVDVFLEQRSELVFVPDDGSVEEFVTECSHPSFGVGVDLR